MKARSSQLQPFLSVCDIESNGETFYSPLVAPIWSEHCIGVKVFMNLYFPSLLRYFSYRKSCIIMQLHEDFESIHSGGLILRCWKGFLATSTLESPKASHIVFHMYHRVTPTINLEFPKIHKYYLKRFVSTFSCEYDKN